MSQTSKAIISKNGTVTEELQQQAIDADVERQILERVHPDLSERILHFHGDCDGSCVRAFNGMNLEGVDCR